MAREARKRSNAGIYHVMLVGIIINMKEQDIYFKTDISIRQLSRVLWVGKTIVERAIK